MTACGCHGPLIWFSVPDDDAPAGRGAVLQCAHCGHFQATVWFFHDAHHATAVLREEIT